MSLCYLRQNDRDVREYAKYDGTLEGLQAVQRILPRAWSSSYTITEGGVTEFRITGKDQQVYFDASATFVVVDRFGALELHDPSSFYFLFNEDSTISQLDAVAEEYVW